jgi:predicted transcriptional regulator
MDDLAKLFGSAMRVKLLRLFVFNSDAVFDKEEVAKRARVSSLLIAKELQALVRMGILEKKSYTRIRRDGRGQRHRVAVPCWLLKKQYSLLDALQTFLEKTLSVSEKEVRATVRSAGTVHLLALSGFLTGNKDGSLDMLVVGEKIDVPQLEKAVRSLEAEYGKELRYALLSPEEYFHRKRVRDKLVRDVLDFSHRIIIDRASSE